MKKIILIDATSFIFRAFYAMPPLSNASGEPTGAITGFANMIHKVLQDYTGVPIVAFFDMAGKTHRHDWYESYKANRSAAPDDLIAQIAPIHDMVKALGIPFIGYKGVEADDLISCVARHYSDTCLVTICSPDKDFAQLVSDKITIENPMDLKTVTPATVQEKYGVLVEQLTDYFALIGDSSDNIPGVPKIGPKTAQMLINKYNSLEGIYEAWGELKGVVAKNLSEYKEDAFLSRKLFRFQTQEELFWPSELNPDSLPEVPQPYLPDLISLYERYELRRLLARLPAPVSIVPKIYCQNWDINDSSLAEDLLGGTIGVQLKENDLWEIGFFSQDVWHKGEISTKMLQSWICQRNDLIWASYDWKVNWHKLKVIPHHFADLSLIQHMSEPDEKQNWTKVVEKEMISDSATLTIVKMIERYQDTLGPSQVALLEAIEKPLIVILARMESHGVLVDKQLLESLDFQWNERLGSLKEQAYLYANKEFNLNSSKQVREILFEGLKLPSKIKTPKGELSTNEAALEELRAMHPLVDILLEYRHYEKLRSTYTHSWLQRLGGEFSRLHTTYDQKGTVTGRLSSLDPNLQNIPVRTEQGRQLRRTIIAPTGFSLVSFDYSQIELRIMAHFSQDPSLMTAYELNHDLHSHTASMLEHVELDLVTDEQRARAKTVNFGLIYGMSAFGLAKQLGTPISFAQNLIDQYFSIYKGVALYMNTVRSQSKEQGFVETLMGRKIPVRPQNTKGGGDNAWRAAINGPLQGTASELIKKAMINLQPLLEQDPRVQMIMQVHDELVFEVPNDLLSSWPESALKVMESSMTLRVPLRVNYSVGVCWE